MTIEERARECYNRRGLPAVAFLEKAEYGKVCQEDGYIAGATEQKKIDVEKACEWLMNHEKEIYWAIESPVCRPPLRNVVNAFRIAMGED